jgi:hypothetical protein
MICKTHFDFAQCLEQKVGSEPFAKRLSKKREYNKTVHSVGGAWHSADHGLLIAKVFARSLLPVAYAKP